MERSLDALLHLSAFPTISSVLIQHNWGVEKFQLMDIHYFAAARAARGAAQETCPPSEKTLGDLLKELGEKHTDTTAAGMSLAQVFERCTFLIDGRSSDTSASLSGASRVDVLPPFAGG